MSNKYINIYNSIKVTVGTNAILLIDDSNNKYFHLSIEFLDIFRLFKRIPLEKIYEIYENEKLESFVNFLLKENIAFLLNKRIINEQLDDFEIFGLPKISNAVIEINNLELVPYYKNVLAELIELHCKYLVVFVEVDFEELKCVFNDNRFISTFYIDFKKNKERKISLPSINASCIIYNYPDIVIEENNKNLKYINLDLTLKNHNCGLVNTFFFTINPLHYTESLHHNTCLNLKISIDTEGNIKNCPSMKESFGNIKDTTLQEAIEKPGFKKYWNITKDQIAVCKDCEFRHVCTDCRAYLEDPEDDYSKPLKCGYNPYTCEWEEWSTNPLKQKAIDYYGMRDIMKNEELIKNGE